ncbi:VIT1/CCC1 transporter family protein [Candidatus Woesearchaeota archaeon]|nr:VIT1/CCC1 transporter family protein [Candidatus Woesearchaeota archaeon]
MLSKYLDKKRKNTHKHVSSGKYIKSFVYGGLDGTITTFAVVAGVAGAALNPSVVLILGFANLIADGISMAVGDYLSSKAEREYGRSERKKEEGYMKRITDERKRLIKVYINQGFNKKEANLLAGIVCKNKKACVDVLLNYELGISDRQNNPLKNSAATFGSFVLFGFVPLITYVFSKLINLFQENTFLLASIFTCLTLFALGAAKYKFTGRSWYKSGVEMLLVGGIAAAAAYLIGHFVSVII